MRPLVFVVACLLPLSLLAEEARKADRLNLDGTWTIVRGEKDGKPEPEDRIEGSVVVITGNKITGTDRDKKEFFACTFTLDTSKTPWQIKMVSAEPKKGEVSRGILEKDGDTLKLCYQVRTAAPPTTFKTTKDQHCFVLKKVKDRGAGGRR
jgi:uncharacterized protein (TIGR03067 family)